MDSSSDRHTASIPLRRVGRAILCTLFLIVAGAVLALNAADPPTKAQVLETDELRIRVVPIVRGLVHPWSLAFLPDGSMLITERPGRLRIVRNGVLDPTPISGMPAVAAISLQGLMAVAPHPKFAENKLVYFTYSKSGPDHLTATALARGRLEGNDLTDVRDVFVTAPWVQPSAMASVILFAPDGTLYMTVGGAINATSTGQLAQDPRNHYGKILRLREDGTVPPDNPFVGRAGYQIGRASCRERV